MLQEIKHLALYELLRRHGVNPGQEQKSITAMLCYVLDFTATESHEVLLEQFGESELAYRTIQKMLQTDREWLCKEFFWNLEEPEVD
ncbi:MAG: hypothetical protein KDB23_16530 [Planctomycetales bacterium]|nr:hypothetical protein [Planctomycetales bacterium]